VPQGWRNDPAAGCSKFYQTRRPKATAITQSPHAECFKRDINPTCVCFAFSLWVTRDFSGKNTQNASLLQSAGNDCRNPTQVCEESVKCPTRRL
ncbi:hypothetical protein AVEN_10922-1, partial [Araneus ventricosus]